MCKSCTVYTYALDAYAKQSIRTCAIIHIHLHIGWCVCNNRSKHVQSYVYALDAYAKQSIWMYAIILINIFIRCICNNRYEPVQSNVYTYALDAFAKQSIQMCAIIHIHICIGCICKTIDTNVCNQYVYTYALNAFAKQSIQSNVYTYVLDAFAKQSIQMCAIICIHIFIGCMWNNRYIYTYALNMYAIIHMNVWCNWREYMGVRSSAISSSEKRILQYFFSSLLNYEWSYKKIQKRAQAFVTLWILQKRSSIIAYNHITPMFSWTKSLIRFGHSGSLSLSLNLSLSIEFIPK
jgi:hypothetical protein